MPIDVDCRVRSLTKSARVALARAVVSVTFADSFDISNEDCLDLNRIRLYKMNPAELDLKTRVMKKKCSTNHTCDCHLQDWPKGQPLTQIFLLLKQHRPLPPLQLHLRNL